MTEEQFVSELVKLKPLDRWKFIARHRPFDIVAVVATLGFFVAALVRAFI